MFKFLSIPHQRLIQHLEAGRAAEALLYARKEVARHPAPTVAATFAPKLRRLEALISGADGRGGSAWGGEQRSPMQQLLFAAAAASEADVVAGLPAAQLPGLPDYDFAAALAK